MPQRTRRIRLILGLLVIVHSPGGLAEKDRSAGVRERAQSLLEGQEE